MKNLRYALMSALMLIAGSVMADDVVIDFNAMDLPLSYSANANEGIEASTAGDIEQTWTTSVGNVTIEVSPKDEEVSNTNNRFWKTNNGPQLRCYSGTITLRATQAMKAITFEANGSYFNMTPSVGTLTGKVWAGEATEVVFTVSKNTQLNKITVSFDGGSVVPDPQPTNEEITVAKALEIISALADGGKTSEDYSVKGIVVGTPDFQRKDDNTLYGNVNFDMADTTDGECLTVFRAKDFNGASFTEETINRIKEGDVVVVKGKLQKYVKDGVTTPEIASGGILVSVNDGSGVSAITVSKAFEDAIYNIAGQKVDKSYKGLVIMNGRKYVSK